MFLTRCHLLLTTCTFMPDSPPHRDIFGSQDSADVCLQKGGHHVANEKVNQQGGPVCLCVWPQMVSSKAFCAILSY
jgi:hypothetical protein